MLSACLFRGKKIQDLFECYRVFHAGNDAHRATAILAGFDIDMKRPFKSLAPAYRLMALGEAAVIPVSIGLLATLAPARRSDQSPMFAIRCKDTMKASEIDPGLGYQGSHSCHKVESFENHMGGAGAKWRLQFITHLAGWCQGEALFCNGGSGYAATEPLQLFALMGVGGHASV